MGGYIEHSAKAPDERLRGMVQLNRAICIGFGELGKGIDARAAEGHIDENFRW
ncbi:MAG: hypothetical protein Kow00107_03520 [Planctomycetota bacterium]